MKMIVGIDPGLTGAVAQIVDGKPVEVLDMPVMGRITGKGKMINGSQLTSILLDWRPHGVVLEKVSAMPGQGVTAMFNFGFSVGVVHGVLAALQIPYVEVTPNAWKKKAGLLRKDKDVARSLCITEYPHLADELTRKKDVGRADAILIGVHGS